MAPSLTQDTRIGELLMPARPDMALTRLESTAGLSELFEHRVEAVSERADLDFSGVVGSHATVVLRGYDRAETFFDGVVTEAQWLGVRDDLFVYRFVLRPWLWLLSQTSDCRIFRETSVPDIVRQIVAEKDFGPIDLRMVKDYPPREYTVQYRETHLAFVCRLMEDAGISFHFRHEAGSHTLVLSDAPGSFDRGDGLPFVPLQGPSDRHEAHISHWVPERRLTSGKVTINDYDFKKPRADLVGEARQSGGHHANDELELYDFPGSYEDFPGGMTPPQTEDAKRWMKTGWGADEGTGRAIAHLRLDAERAADGRALASGSAPALRPGLRFDLTRHPMTSQNHDYLVLRATHSYASQSYRSGGTDVEDSYSGQYEVMRAEVPFAPPRVTERPFVHGHQTARVVSEKYTSNEIDVDKYGRILVEFFWDREKQISRRCRVAQIWSGSGWGGIVTPRVGMEVVVGFLEGDPDHPIVLGTVYNGENMPPYTLPEKKTISGVKSRSTPHGKGYNEFIFDDAKGAELVRLHAQRDLESRVLNNERRNVGSNRSTTIGVNDTLTVGRNREATIGSNDTLIVGADRSTTIGRDVSLIVGRHESHAVAEQRVTSVRKGDTLSVGETLYVYAGKEIQFVVGQSSIKMTGDKIEIEAIDIEITASGKLTTDGLMAEHKAEASLVVEARLVKIN